MRWEDFTGTLAEVAVAMPAGMVLVLAPLGHPGRCALLACSGGGLRAETGGPAGPSGGAGRRVWAGAGWCPPLRRRSVNWWQEFGLDGASGAGRMVVGALRDLHEVEHPARLAYTAFLLRAGGLAEITALAAAGLTVTDPSRVTVCLHLDTRPPPVPGTGRGEGAVPSAAGSFPAGRSREWARRLREQREHRVADLGVAGWAPAEIGRVLEIPARRVRRILGDRGLLPVPPPDRLDRRQTDQIVRLYQQQATLARIAADLGVAPGTVRQALKSRAVDIRRPGGNHRQPDNRAGTHAGTGSAGERNL